MFVELTPNIFRQIIVYFIFVEICYTRKVDNDWMKSRKPRKWPHFVSKWLNFLSKVIQQTQIYTHSFPRSALNSNLVCLNNFHFSSFEYFLTKSVKSSMNIQNGQRPYKLHYLLHILSERKRIAALIYSKRKWLKESFPKKKKKFVLNWIIKLHFVDIFRPSWFLFSLNMPQTNAIPKNRTEILKKTNFLWFCFWNMLQSRIFMIQ